MDNKPAPVDVVIYVRVEGAALAKARAILQAISQLQMLQDDGIIGSYDWEAVSI